MQLDTATGGAAANAHARARLSLHSTGASSCVNDHSPCAFLMLVLLGVMALVLEELLVVMALVLEELLGAMALVQGVLVLVQVLAVQQMALNWLLPLRAGMGPCLCACQQQ
jgi:hypothetical protein